MASTAVIALAACTAQPPTGASPAPTGPGGASPTAATQRGAGDELVILYWQAPTILNPHQATGTKDVDASRLILEPLAAWGPDGKPVPYTAAEIPSVANGGVTADLTSVTWKLKPGVKWSDGSPFTADDVVFTWKYQCDPLSGATSATFCPDIESVEAKDPNTVVVTFKAANPNFLGTFGVASGNQVLQKKQFEPCLGAKAKDCPENMKPIGTGPYKLVEFRPGDTVTYDINPNYRDADKPFFKNVTIKGGGDAEGAARAVCQTGDADYGWNLQVPLTVLNPMIQAADSKCQFAATYLALERVHINYSNPDPALGEQRSEPGTEHPFLTDLAVRRALAMAANRTAVAEQLYGAPGGIPECNWIAVPKSPNTASMDVCKHDLAAAEAELEKAGYVRGADGVRAKGGVRLELTYQTSTNAVRQRTQEILKADWEKIGFKVNLTNYDAATYFTQESPTGISKFYADLEEFASNQDPDPTLWMAQLICAEAAGKDNQWGKANQGDYCDPAYDALFERFKAETDQAKRDAIAIEINDYAVKNVAMIALVLRTAPTPNGYSKALKGVNGTPFDSSLWDIANWSK